MTKSTTAILMMVNTFPTVADSLVPMTSNSVNSATISNGPQLMVTMPRSMVGERCTPTSWKTSVR